MEKTSNYLLCKTLAGSEVHIKVEQEGAKVQLVDGKAYLQRRNDTYLINISNRQSKELEHSEYVLYSETSFSFRIHGHYQITKSQVRGDRRMLKMFEVLQTESNIQFIIGKEFQLVMLHRNENKCISFEIFKGLAYVLGPAFPYESCCKRFYLPPFSPFLLRVRVHGHTYSSIEYHTYSSIIINDPNKMDFYISPFDLENWKNFNRVLTATDVVTECAKSQKITGPVYLVLGKRNLSKIGFCTLFIDRAIRWDLEPVYVDLNVRGNSSGIPGSVRIFQIVGRGNVNRDGCHISKIYLKKNEKVFTLGYEDPNSNIRLYHLLMRKLSDLSREMSKEDKERKSVTLVDMCDFLNNPTAIKRVCSAFKFSKIIVIGDQGLLDKMYNLCPTGYLKFIEHIDDFELPSDYFRNSLIKEYVGIQNNFVVKFSDIQIYNVEGSAGNVEFDTIIRPEEFRAVPVVFNNDLQRHFLGVSECSTIDKHLPVTPVKYFVLIMSVNMEKQYLCIASPTAEPLTGSILIKGHIKV